MNAAVPGVPDGNCICTTLADGRIRIDQADPRILISDELLYVIARFGDDDRVGAWLPHARLDMTGCMPPPWRATYVGAVLKISGVNRQVVYRITDYVAGVNGYVYIGQWPD